MIDAQSNLSRLPDNTAALAALESDLRMFERNPDLFGFIRRPMPGEAPPQPAPEGHSLAAVFMRSVLPGMRTRRAIYRPTPEAAQ